MSTKVKKINRKLFKIKNVNKKRLQNLTRHDYYSNRQTDKKVFLNKSIDDKNETKTCLNYIIGNSRHVIKRCKQSYIVTYNSAH